MCVLVLVCVIYLGQMCVSFNTARLYNCSARKRILKKIYNLKFFPNKKTVTIFFFHKTKKNRYKKYFSTKIKFEEKKPLQFCCCCCCFGKSAVKWTRSRFHSESMLKKKILARQNSNFPNFGGQKKTSFFFQLFFDQFTH